MIISSVVHVFVALRHHWKPIYGLVRDGSVIAVGWEGEEL